MTGAIEQDPPDVRLDEPHPATRRSFLALMAALIGPAASAQDDVEDRGKSTARLATMRRLAKGVKLAEVVEEKPGPPCPLRPEPLLRYGDPGRDIVEGTLWAWGEGGRPPAVMKLEYRGPTADQRSWVVGVSALSPKRVEVQFRDGTNWSSRQPGLQPRPLPDAPAPADSAAHRLVQAKDLARRFSIGVDTHTDSGRIQLRLLPRPIDRYSDPEAGLIDGVLFTFVYATNPIVLLGLEAWSDRSGARNWRFGFVRQGTGEATALLDGKSVWTVPALTSPIDSELYMARMMPEAATEK